MEPGCGYKKIAHSFFLQDKHRRARTSQRSLVLLLVASLQERKVGNGIEKGQNLHSSTYRADPGKKQANVGDLVDVVERLPSDLGAEASPDGASGLGTQESAEELGCAREVDKVHGIEVRADL